VAAICEMTGVHIDRHARKAIAFPDAVRIAALDLAVCEPEVS